MNCKVKVCLFLLSLAPITAMAQNITSTVVGQVNDASGNGVASARVTITNTATGTSMSGVTSPTGFYSVSGIQPGTYSVAISAPGFSTYKVSGVTVHALETARVNAALAVGATSSTVHVSGSAPLLTTDSPSVGATINTHQIRALPSSVQSIGPLLSLVPGALANTGYQSSPQFAGAAHWGANYFTLNGLTIDDLVNGGGAYAYTSGDPNTNLINQPPIDTLQEFQVIDVNANAEFNGMSNIIMVTKQGTNQFHGDLYEFFKNADLNANSYQLNAQGKPRPQNNLNQFGGSIGGPIWKGKAFFFFAPAFYRSIAAGLTNLNWPSQAMHNGDFSALLAEDTQLYNPLTGQPFVNNQIPSSMIAPQAATLVKNLPLPLDSTSPGLPGEKPNFIESVPVRTSMNSYTGRGDYQIRSSDALFGVFTSATTPEWNVFLGYAPNFGNASDFGFIDRSVNIGETHTFSPTALNQLRIGWFTHTSLRWGVNKEFDPATLFSQLTPGVNRGQPTMAASGYNNVSYDYGNNGLKPAGTVIEFNDNFTKVVHNHSLKFGFDELGYRLSGPGGKGDLGSFSFSGNWTGNKGWPGQPQSQGNAFADFLLGDANSATRGTVAVTKNAWERIWEGYGQDTWQATQRLTVTYGLRYMFQSATNVTNNARSLFDPTTGKIALPQNSAATTLPVDGNAAFYQAYLPYFVTTQSVGLSTHYMKPAKDNWAPRVGFAYRIGDHTVIRGGYGIFYNYLIIDMAYWDSLNIPFGTNTETANTKLPGKPTAPYLPDIVFANPFGNAAVNTSSNPTVFYQQPDMRPARVQQYSLSVEHQFFQNWVTRITYVGMNGRNLPYFEQDFNQPAAQIPNVPYQEQRPYQPWGTINSVRSDGGGIQNFSQLQLELARRFTNGISFQANYSLTSDLDNVDFVGGPQQIRFPNLDYGNAEGTQKNTLIFNYLYALPFGRGRTWLHNSSALVNAVAGGWQVSGITSYATGFPFSVRFAAPSNYIGWTAGRADRVPGVSLHVPHSGHNVIKGVPYFNPAAFGPPEPWTWGTSGRNSFWGPGFWNWDISTMKHFSTPGERVQVTLRADFFDAFNHFNLSGPNATVSSSEYGGVPQPAAGLITAGSGNRTIQLGLRTSF